MILSLPGGCPRCGGHHSERACVFSAACAALEDRFGPFIEEPVLQADLTVYLEGQGFDRSEAVEAAAWFAAANGNLGP